MNQLMEGYYLGRYYRSVIQYFRFITFLRHLDSPNKTVAMPWPWKIRMGEKLINGV